MGCPNNSAVGWGCAESAGCSATAAAECAETADSADNFQLVPQNVVENSEENCNEGECCYWTTPETGTFSFVLPSPCAYFPNQ